MLDAEVLEWIDYLDDEEKESLKNLLEEMGVANGNNSVHQ